MKNLENLASRGCVHGAVAAILVVVILLGIVFASLYLLRVHNARGLYSVATMNQSGKISLDVIRPSEKAHNVYSVAKLFTVLAVGICHDEGKLSPEDRIIDVLEIDLTEQHDPKWGNVTIDMLLSHKAGFGAGLMDIDVDDVSAYGTKNYLEYVLSAELPREQGKDYVYTDAAYYLLSLAVEKVSGKSLEEFLRPVIFDVLEFAEYSWTKCPMGHTIGATGLYVRAEDFCKLGRIFAEGGTYLGERVVSEEWCNIAIEREYSIRHLRDGWYFKDGMYGQYIAFNIETKEVLACSAFVLLNDLGTLVDKYFN